VKRRRGRLLTILAATLALAGTAAAAVFLLGASDQSGDYRGSEPPAMVRLPDFTLPDYAGEIVSSSELEGKVTLITFLDSQCTEACPIIASQIARAWDRLSAEERDEVVPIAISTDPDEDTAASVGAFLRRNRAEGKLRYLVAPVPKLRPVWNAFHIAASFDTGVDTLHSAPVRIYDREGVWVSTLHAGADLTTENLLHDVRAVVSAS
jgi:cytochrome oxidase Cu insertion factor (SCO1/SenC/PrrC family)